MDQDGLLMGVDPESASELFGYEVVATSAGFDQALPPVSLSDVSYLDDVILAIFSQAHSLLPNLRKFFEIL
eukprot:10176125-Karenia_brevis.AAC.1